MSSRVPDDVFDALGRLANQTVGRGGDADQLWNEIQDSSYQDGPKGYLEFDRRKSVREWLNTLEIGEADKLVLRAHFNAQEYQAKLADDVSAMMAEYVRRCPDLFTGVAGGTNQAVLRALLVVAVRSGKQFDRAAQLSFTLDHRTIASMANVTRKTVGAVLDRLRSAGVIARGRGQNRRGATTVHVVTSPWVLDDQSPSECTTTTPFTPARTVTVDGITTLAGSNTSQSVSAQGMYGVLTVQSPIVGEHDLQESEPSGVATVVSGAVLGHAVWTRNGLGSAGLRIYVALASGGGLTRAQLSRAAHRNTLLTKLPRMESLGVLRCHGSLWFAIPGVAVLDAAADQMGLVERRQRIEQANRAEREVWRRGVGQSEDGQVVTIYANRIGYRTLGSSDCPLIRLLAGFQPLSGVDHSDGGSERIQSVDSVEQPKVSRPMRTAISRRVPGRFSATYEASAAPTTAVA